MGEWAKGTFACMDSCGTCIVTMFVPFVTFGKNAEAAGVTSCLMGGLSMFVPLLNLYCLIKVRGAIREKYGIEGSVVKDIACILCCGFCSIIQEAAQVAQAPGEAVDRS